MAPMKRTVILAGALAALTACAPAGTGATNNAAAEPVANAAAEASPEASAEAEGPDVELTAELIGKKVRRMGEVVTDEDGWVLYRFDKDTANPPTSNCVDECERIWPPVYTDGRPSLKGVSDDVVGTVTRQDGTKQVTLDGWPIYRYIGDKEPGQWKGQGVGGTWFVVAPDGKKNLSCLPKGTPKPVAPPADDAPAEDAPDAEQEETGGDSSAGGGSDYGY